MTDKWAAVPSYEDRYSVSTAGRIKSIRSGRMLAQPLVRGYLSVSLFNGVSSKTFKVHVIVLAVFGPVKPGPKYEARHKDGTRTNAHIDNLEWGTRQDNMLDKRKHGTARVTRGARVGTAKLSQGCIDRVIDLARAGALQREVGAHLGVCQQMVSRIVRGEAWLP